MKLQIIACGKIKEKWLQAGIDEYKKRLGKYCDLTITEVMDAPDQLPRSQALEKEGRQLIDKIRPNTRVIALDLDGRMYSSQEFSSFLISSFERSGADLTFLIGGSNGFSSLVLERCSERVCLSPMTFTHQMARLLLLEQCYRAFKISRNEKYHK